MFDKVIFYSVPLLSGFGLVLILTWLVRRWARELNIVDRPDSLRKIHDRPIPLGGGLALFLTLIPLLVVFWKSGWLTSDRITALQIIGLLVASIVILVGGLLDDKYNLNPRQQLVAPLVAVIIVVWAGLRVEYITNPTGGVIWLADWQSWLPPAIAFVWLLGMMYTTKLLDGLDGLVSGIGAIGAIIIFIVSLSWNEPYSAVSVMALLLAGTTLGFLFYNFHPASIFLGEAGSLLIGFWLGVLAIIAGSKIATALLIMGIPILDVVWVILRRAFIDRRSIAQGDRKHLHHRLLNLGWGQRRVVIFLYLLTVLFGSVAVWQKTIGKIISLFVLLIVMIIIGAVLVRNYHFNQQKNKPDV